MLNPNQLKLLYTQLFKDQPGTLTHPHAHTHAHPHAHPHAHTHAHPHAHIHTYTHIVIILGHLF